MSLKSVLVFFNFARIEGLFIVIVVVVHLSAFFSSFLLSYVLACMFVCFLSLCFLRFVFLGVLYHIRIGNSDFL